MLWLFVIFGFSAQDADTSDKASGKVIDSVAHVAVEGYDEYTPTQKNAFIKSQQHLVRKLAHATEFAILAALLFVALLTVPFPKEGSYRSALYVPLKWRVIAVAMGCLLTATLDELSQLASEGRSGQITDVLIDFCGSAFAIAVTVGVALIVRQINKSTDCSKNSKAL